MIPVAGEDLQAPRASGVRAPPPPLGPGFAGCDWRLPADLALFPPSLGAKAWCLDRAEGWENTEGWQGARWGWKGSAKGEREDALTLGPESRIGSPKYQKPRHWGWGGFY